MSHAHTCAASSLPIPGGTPVRAFLVYESPHFGGYSPDGWYLRSHAIRAEYDEDTGTLRNWEDGPILRSWLEVLALDLDSSIVPMQMGDFRWLLQEIRRGSLRVREYFTNEEEMTPQEREDVAAFRLARINRARADRGEPALAVAPPRPPGSPLRVDLCFIWEDVWQALLMLPRRNEYDDMTLGAFRAEFRALAGWIAHNEEDDAAPADGEEPVSARDRAHRMRRLTHNQHTSYNGLGVHARAMHRNGTLQSVIDEVADHNWVLSVMRTNRRPLCPAGIGPQYACWSDHIAFIEAILGVARAGLAAEEKWRAEFEAEAERCREGA